MVSVKSSAAALRAPTASPTVPVSSSGRLVKAEDRCHRRAIEHAGLDHPQRTARFLLLGRLKQQHDRPDQATGMVALDLAECGGGGEQDGGVGIVAAGVHHPRTL